MKVKSSQRSYQCVTDRGDRRLPRVAVPGCIPAGPRPVQVAVSTRHHYGQVLSATRPQWGSIPRPRTPPSPPPLTATCPSPSTPLLSIPHSRYITKCSLQVTLLTNVLIFKQYIKSIKANWRRLFILYRLLQLHPCCAVLTSLLCGLSFHRFL